MVIKLQIDRKRCILRLIIRNWTVTDKNIQMIISESCTYYPLGLNVTLTPTPKTSIIPSARKSPLALVLVLHIGRFDFTTQHAPFKIIDTFLF